MPTFLCTTCNERTIVGVYIGQKGVAPKCPKCGNPFVEE
jgi:predicted RNA-binding Zn-ribbon protein involved in translation (DUF1610 family)